MKFNSLPTTTIQISEIALGCMSFHTKQQGKPIIEAALELGVNFFDTADLYDKGENERILGQVLTGKRKEVVIATKVGNRWKKDGLGWEWVPRKGYILQAAEDSLRRLNTDYIDLYQLHGGTIDDPMDEVIEAFEILKKQGKIRAYGISSIRPNTIRQWTALGEGASCMSQYSLLDRRPEEFILPHLQKQQQIMLVRGALAKGLLAGKMAKDYLGKTQEKVAKTQELIQSLAAHYAMSALALHYVLSQNGVGAVVLGASHKEQLINNVKTYDSSSVSEGDIAALRSEIEAEIYSAHR